MGNDAFTVESFPSLVDRFAPENTSAKLRVCIAAEEIAGPVRNGGIASTYFTLARTLAADGHEVVVCYLKGHVTDDHDIDYWVRQYRTLGIELCPLPQAAEKLESSFWLLRSYRFVVWLQNQAPFDVVHVSEWRGGAFYALVVKRLGLAFQNTLFVMKASSPYIWNRAYMMRYLESEAQLALMYAEQKSIELADIVIGGSAHLLSFMRHMGYRLSPDGVYVQPNIVDSPGELAAERSRKFEFGQRVEIKELVFFGRLEARKGLDIFCDALDSLGEATRGIEKVTFMGKEGQNLLIRPNLSPTEYIYERAERWSFPIAIETKFGPSEAVAYLAGGQRLAVMPSIIENSTMAVYETLVNRIPFVASAVGGTPELVATEHHETLVPPTVGALAARIRDFIRNGGLIARGSFDNEENTAIWRGFHRYLALQIATIGPQALLAELRPSSALEKGGPVTFSACLYHIGAPDALEEAIFSLLLQASRRPEEIIVAMDGSAAAADLAAAEAYLAATAAQIDVPCVLATTPEIGLGEAYNAAALKATRDVLTFSRTDIHRFSENFFGRMATAFESSKVDALSAFYRSEKEGDVALVLPIGGDMASTFVDRRAIGGGVVAIRAAAFETIGGFAEERRTAGVEQELLLRLCASGRRVEVLPEPLYIENTAHSRIVSADASSQFLVMRSMFEGSDIHLKRILLWGGMTAQRGHKAVESRGAIERAASPAASKPTLAANWSISGPPEGDNPRVQIGFSPARVSFEVAVHESFIVGPSPKLLVRLNKNVVATLPLEKRGAFFHAEAPVNRARLRAGSSHMSFSVLGGRFEDLRRGLRILREGEGKRFSIETPRRIVLLEGDRRLEGDLLIAPALPISTEPTFHVPETNKRLLARVAASVRAFSSKVGEFLPR